MYLMPVHLIMLFSFTGARCKVKRTGKGVSIHLLAENARFINYCSSNSFFPYDLFFSLVYLFIFLVWFDYEKFIYKNSLLFAVAVCN